MQQDIVIFDRRDEAIPFDEVKPLDLADNTPGIRIAAHASLPTFGDPTPRRPMKPVSAIRGRIPASGNQRWRPCRRLSRTYSVQWLSNSEHLGSGISAE